MAILQYRLDGRMLHGQVSTFATYLRIDHFIVVNEKIANDDTQVMLLELAAIDASVDVVSPEDAFDLIEEEDDSDDRTMVVFKEISDLKEMVEKGFTCDEVDISGVYARGDREKVAACFFLDAQDREDLKYIMDKGIKLYHQIQNDLKKQDVADLVK